WASNQPRCPGKSCAHRASHHNGRCKPAKNMDKIVIWTNGDGFKAADSNSFQGGNNRQSRRSHGRQQTAKESHDDREDEALQYQEGGDAELKYHFAEALKTHRPGAHAMH